jgi:hypothetical protein
LGYNVTDLIPPEITDSEPGLGASITKYKTSGKIFWEKYKTVLKKYLCEADGKANSYVEKGLIAGTSSAVPLIINTLGLSTAAAPVIGPIVGITTYLGIKKLCT